MLHPNTHTKITSSRILLLICIGLIYWIVSSTFKGPTYLQDEIGYLSNASFFAGYKVDGGSSYHCGYSIFIAPLFRLLNNPFAIWQGLILFNTIIWCASFFLLFKIGDIFFPDASESQKKIAIIMTSLYPACISMCGYAFPSTFLFFAILLSFYCLFVSEECKWWTIVPHSLLTGFLYWIHPTGLAAVIASGIVLTRRAIKEKKYTIGTIHLFILFFMCASYQKVVQPGLLTAMTPEGFLPSTHYPSIKKLLLSLASLTYISKVLLLVCGQISYIIIATGGVFIGGVQALHSCTPQKTTAGKNTLVERKNEACAFILLSILGVMFMAAMEFACHKNVTNSIWFYGRYTEPFYLVFLYSGFFVNLKQKYLLALSAFATAMVAIAYQVQHTEPMVNLVRIQAFWPQVFLQSTSFATLIACGFAVIIFLNFSKRSIRNSVLIFIFLATIKHHYEYHHTSFRNHSSPTSMVGFVRNRLAPKSIIGIQPQPRGFDKSTERLKMYSFYFFDYDYRRINLDDWKKLDANKFYLTYNIESIKTNKTLHLLARELDVGLYLCATDKSSYATPKEKEKFSSRIYLNSLGKTKDLVSGCFKQSADVLKLTTQVGEFDNGTLNTKGKRGFLFYGPYFTMGPGKFKLILKACALSTTGAVLDITCNNGSTKLGEFVLDNCHKRKSENSKESLFEIPFILEETVSSFEIRLAVSENSDIKVFGYEVRLLE